MIFYTDGDIELAKENTLKARKEFNIILEQDKKEGLRLKECPLSEEYGFFIGRGQNGFIVIHIENYMALPSAKRNKINKLYGGR